MVQINKIEIKKNIINNRLNKQNDLIVNITYLFT